jgi:starch synthase
MNVLFVTSEVAPFAKAGGLGDVSASLPRHLAALGHDVRVFVPMYRRVHAPGRVFTEVIPEIAFTVGPHTVKVGIYSSLLPGTSLPIYFIRCPSLYDRASIYGQDADEHLRFAVLNWAALKACQHMGFAPDVAHCNDWTAALVPVLLRSVFRWDKLFEKTRTVLTIHNLGHQGTFLASALPETGLEIARSMLHQERLDGGYLGFLANGILHANAITTVSPTYAREIQTAEHGVGLDGLLRQRRDVLFGILNGIDEDEWNPARDPHTAAPFDAEHLDGKERCKQVLLDHVGLPYRRDVPVVTMVSRLVWQKGFDLCQKVLPTLLRRKRFQLVILGAGEPRFEEWGHQLQRAFPRQVAYQSHFTEKRAHVTEAGGDLFLMPSRYEPCGLNQMYSLRYGTVPIVHRTGGLADTVFPYDVRTGIGTGFVFNHFDESGLAWALARGIDVWGSGQGAERARWQRLQRVGMKLPLGWKHRIGEYVDLYRKLAPVGR